MVSISNGDVSSQAADQRLIEGFAGSALEVQSQARARWQSSESYQSRVISKYRELHHYYNPINGDQWPEDAALRPGKIHTTSNLCRIAVDVEARIESLHPRMTIPIDTLAPADRKRAEGAEAMMMQWLDMAGFDTWFFTLAQTKALYGKGVLKPYWDPILERPEVTVIENPANLRLGWGSSDYTRIDWAVYEYGISALEAKIRWPNVNIEPSANRMDPPHIMVSGGDHADPLSQKDDSFWRPFYREHSEYERTQLKVWDYWYKDRKGTVWNSVLLNGVVVEDPTEHTELVDIPYIVIEHDHEPGSPEGLSTIEPIIDLQVQFNRLLSHGLQHVADDVDPAWYLSGEGADTVPAGMVPKAGEVVGVGDNTPGAWPKSVNTFPIAEMMQELWNEFHRLTGLPEILFGQSPGADTSGRAIAIQVEAAANRLEPRRRRLYQGLKDLLVFWTIMAERKNPSISVGEETLKIGDIVKGFYTWKIIAPEMTPRDNMEVTQIEIQKVQSLLTTRRSAMDRIGTEAPEAEMSGIEQEQSNLKVNPGAVQAQLAVLTLAAQLERQRMENQQLQAQLGAIGQPAPTPGSVLQQSEGSVAQLQNERQSRGPSRFEDQNQPLPATNAGSPPPAGAPPAGGAGPAQLTGLVRQGEPLQQIAFSGGQ